MAGRLRPGPGVFGLLAFVVGLSGCAGTGVPGGTADPGAGVQVSDPQQQEVRSVHGAVATASVWATEVGARILAEGGNAADAAIAAAWALAVTEPSMSGIGGRSSILVRTPDGEVSGIDGLNQVPRSYREGVAPEGYDRVAIPGVPAALQRLHEAQGSFPMARLLEPAIRLAEEGFELPEPEAARLAGAAEDLLAFSPEAARGTYLQPDGTPWPAGTRLRQPELAETLKILRDEGVEAFYRGRIAARMDADMRARGAFVTADELAGYEALPAYVVRGSYRGYGLVSNFRPASGHAVIQALQTLEAATPEGLPPLWRDGRVDPVAHAQWAALLGQVMEQAIGERNRVEAGGEAASAALLTSGAHAAVRAAELVRPWISGAEMGGAPGAGREVGAAQARTDLPTFFLRATLPREEEQPERGGGATSGVPGAMDPSGPPGTLVTDPRDREATTHLTVVDARGMIVSLTQSLGPSMGARVVAPGLGFLYATRLGAVPGSRPASTIAPTLVLRPDDTLLAGLGGAGDARILSAVIQTVSRLVDHGLSLEQAVAAPRVHPDGVHRFRIETIEPGPGGAAPGGLESGWGEAERRHLGHWGFTLEPTPPGYFGRVHAVGWTPGIPQRSTSGFPDPPPAGEAHGVAEPRWDGGAASPRQPPPQGR